VVPAGFRHPAGPRWRLQRGPDSWICMRLSYFRRPDAWRRILVRTYREIIDDNCLGLAAQLAFYFILALFPALLFVAALLSLLPASRVLDPWFDALASVAPHDVLLVMRTQIEEAAGGGERGLLTIGLLGAIWSSSAAMTALIDTLNRAYDIDEGRPWWKKRLLAILLTVALAFLLIVASVLLVVGAPVLGFLGSLAGMSQTAVTIWQVLRWPIAILLVLLGIDLVYYSAPNADTEWTWITPGAVLALALWFGASLGFKVYVQNFADFGATYGTIGGAIVLLLWFYLSGFAILVGAELNSEIDNGLVEQGRSRRHLGERTVIGPAAERP
jgi:membrane protein